MSSDQVKEQQKIKAEKTQHVYLTCHTLKIYVQCDDEGTGWRYRALQKLLAEFAI